MSCYVTARVANQLLQMGSRRTLSRFMASVPTTMKSWQINKYGDNRVLEEKNTRVPIISKPDQIIVKVHAASVNPVDIANRGGYGRQLLSRMRKQSGASEFPLVLGRDFSGVVMETGQEVKNLKHGDEVWGISSAQNQGTHAEYALVSTSEISIKPSTLSHIQAASMPYVALTTWAAMVTFGKISEEWALDKKFLVYAGSGGVGSFAIQLLKSWGAEVVTTCSTDAVPMVTSLGADHVIDYKTQNVKKELKEIGGMDFILDTLGGNTTEKTKLLKMKNASLVTIVTPLLKDTDQYGVVFGLASSSLSYMKNVFQGGGRTYRWAFCMPNTNALNSVSKLVDQQQIRPVIDEVFPFDKIPEAFAKLERGGARGKTVIDVIGSSNVKPEGH